MGTDSKHNSVFGFSSMDELQNYQQQSMPTPSQTMGNTLAGATGLLGSAISTISQTAQLQQQQQITYTQGTNSYFYPAATNITFPTPSTATTGTTYTFHPPYPTQKSWSEELMDEVKELRHVVTALTKELVGLRGQVARLASTHQGLDKSADDILRLMDCYVTEANA